MHRSYLHSIRYIKSFVDYDLSRGSCLPIGPRLGALKDVLPRPHLGCEFEDFEPLEGARGRAFLQVIQDAAVRRRYWELWFQSIRPRSAESEGVLLSARRLDTQSSLTRRGNQS